MIAVRAVAALSLTVTLLATIPAGASAFRAWRVTGVAAGDLLNVRAFPSPRSRLLVGYPNGARLGMTGRCTGGVSLDAIAGLPPPRQRQAVRSVWCEAWLDPDGSGAYRTGWAYGRYLQPD